LIVVIVIDQGSSSTQIFIHQVTVRYLPSRITLVPPLDSMLCHQFILVVSYLLYSTLLASLILPSSSSSSSNVYPSIRNSNNEIIHSPSAFLHRKRFIISPRAGSNNGNDSSGNGGNISNRVLNDKGYSLPSNSQSSGDYNYDTNSDGPSDNNNELSSSRRTNSSSSSNQNDNNNNNNNNNNEFTSRDNTHRNHPLDARQKLQKHPLTATRGIPSQTNLARVTTTLLKRFSVINTNAFKTLTAIVEGRAVRFKPRLKPAKR